MIQYKVVITKGETFMDKDAVQNQPIIRYEDEQLIETEDSYVTEFPLTIMVNGKEFATVICSPTHLEELVIGFLASEGAIYKKKKLNIYKLMIVKGLLM